MEQDANIFILGESPFQFRKANVGCFVLFMRARQNVICLMKLYDSSHPTSIAHDIHRKMCAINFRNMARFAAKNVKLKMKLSRCWEVNVGEREEDEQRVRRSTENEEEELHK